ncbi:MAG: hypothetical protein ACOCZ3_02480 [Bacillota bacterium]
MAEKTLQLIEHLDPTLFREVRWYRHKDRQIRKIKLKDWQALNLSTDRKLLLLCFLELHFAGSKEGPDSAVYYLPLLISPDNTGPGITWLKIRHLQHGFSTYLKEAVHSREYYRILAQLSQTTGKISLNKGGKLIIQGFGQLAAEQAQMLTGVSSNSLTSLGKTVAKTYRNPEPGLNPELEITTALTQKTSFKAFPRIQGYLKYITGNREYTVCLLEEHLEAATNTWKFTRETLAALYADRVNREQILEDYCCQIRKLGQILAEFHLALAGVKQPAFYPEKPTTGDLKSWLQINRDQLGTIKQYSRQHANGSAPLEVKKIIDHQQAIAHRLEQIFELRQYLGQYLRIHGDLHLEQVLKQGSRFFLLDFEGEPLKPLDKRRNKQSPLKDVAGILRSLNYAGYSFLFEHLQDRSGKNGREQSLTHLISSWEQQAAECFMEGYQRRVRARNRLLLPPAKHFNSVLSLFKLEKALYEFLYELNNRPDWLKIPGRGILDCLDK